MCIAEGNIEDSRMALIVAKGRLCRLVGLLATKWTNGPTCCADGEVSKEAPGASGVDA